MLELGTHAAALHAACGKAAAEAHLDMVVGVAAATPSTLQRPLAPPGSRLSFFLTPHAAGEWLKQNLRTGDVALVKGSRGVHLEKALEILNPGFKSPESH